MSAVSLDSAQTESTLQNGRTATERENSFADSVSTLECGGGGAERSDSRSVEMLEETGSSLNSNAVWEENGVVEDVGELVGWGCGEFGQHGHGCGGGDVGAEQGLLKAFSRTEDPLSCARIIACGASHTVIVTYNNEIYAWGNGNSGQLGCGDRETHSEPQRVQLSDRSARVRGVACGSRHTLVWLENGRCYSFGNNYNAQLGYDFKVKNYKENQVLPHVLLHHRDKGRYLDEVKPHLLRTLQHRHVTQVACGERHSVFLFDTGTVAGCGCNANGQIGIGNREEVVTPRFVEESSDYQYVACGAHHTLAIAANGEVHVWGRAKPCGSAKEDLLLPQAKMVPGSAVVRVAGGTSHSLALTENGTVYSWGSGADGQLGHGKTVKFLSQPKRLPRDVFGGARVSQISCAEQYSAVLTVDGQLYMWGKNNHVLRPEKLASNNKVYQPIHVSTGGRGYSQLACGSWHVIAVAGEPVWKPKNEETDEEMVPDGEIPADDEISRSRKKVVLQGNIDVFSDEQSDLETEVGSEPEYPSDVSNDDYSECNLPPEFLKRREKTQLTLEEFYAPTPLPEFVTPAPTPRETPLPLQAPPSPKRNLSRAEDVIQEEDDIPCSGGEAVNALETELQTATLDSKKPDAGNRSEAEDKEESELSVTDKQIFPIPPKATKSSNNPRQTSLPPNRPHNLHITRSKTFAAGDTPISPTVQYSESLADKFQLRREPSSVTNVDLSFESQQKFIVNKHVPLQVNKKKPTLQLPPENPPPVHLNRPKKLNLLRGYVSFEERDHFEQFADNAKSNRPHLTRAHTFYGRSANNQRNFNFEYPVQGGGIAISVDGRPSCRKHSNVVASSPPARKNRRAEPDSKAMPVYPTAESLRARKPTHKISKKVFQS